MPSLPGSGLGAMGGAGKKGTGKIFAWKNSKRIETLRGQGPNCYPFPREFTWKKRERLERIMLSMK